MYCGNLKSVCGLVQLHFCMSNIKFNAFSAPRNIAKEVFSNHSAHSRSLQTERKVCNWHHNKPIITQIKKLAFDSHWLKTSVCSDWCHWFRKSGITLCAPVSQPLIQAQLNKRKYFQSLSETNQNSFSDRKHALTDHKTLETISEV